MVMINATKGRPKIVAFTLNVAMLIACTKHVGVSTLHSRNRTDSRAPTLAQPIPSSEWPVVRPMIAILGDCSVIVAAIPMPNVRSRVSSQWGI